MRNVDEVQVYAVSQYKKVARHLVPFNGRLLLSPWGATFLFFSNKIDLVLRCATARRPQDFLIDTSSNKVGTGVLDCPQKQGFIELNTSKGMSLSCSLFWRTFP